jgi:hypothetical protein
MSSPLGVPSRTKARTQFAQKPPTDGSAAGLSAAGASLAIVARRRGTCQ